MIIDPYPEKLESLIYSDAELEAISAIIATDEVWDLNKSSISETHKSSIIQIKSKILQFHQERQKNKCCYCRCSFSGHGNISIDREHILPKGNLVYKQYTYELWNISIACKTCNMEIKRSRTDFLRDDFDVNEKAEALKPENYLIIHPNFELFSDYINAIFISTEDCEIRYYSKVKQCEKTDFMFSYFNLEERVIAEFYNAQKNFIDLEQKDFLPEPTI